MLFAFLPLRAETVRLQGAKGAIYPASRLSEWSRHIGVLDRVGLALPLYARLLEDGNCSVCRCRLLRRSNNAGATTSRE